jgi:hypothetical protein
VRTGQQAREKGRLLLSPSWIQPLLAVPDNGYPARIFPSFDVELRNIANT